MTKKHLLIGLSVLLAVVLVVLVKNDQSNNEKKAMNYKDNLQKSDAIAPLTNLPPVEKNGDIEGLVNGIITDFADDTTIVSENDADAQYITESAALINSEGVYNENEF